MTYPNNTNYIDHPSAGERARMHREWLAKQGCRWCDVDDPDELEEIALWSHSCPKHQSRAGPGAVVCTEHNGSSEELRRRQLEQTVSQLSENAVLVAYGCGFWQTVRSEQSEVARQHGQKPLPVGPMVCRCGKPVTNVYRDTDDIEGGS